MIVRFQYQYWTLWLQVTLSVINTILEVGKYFFVNVDTQSIVYWGILKMNQITFKNFNTTQRSFLALMRGNQDSSMVNL